MAAVGGLDIGLRSIIHDLTQQANENLEQTFYFLRDGIFYLHGGER